MPPPRDAAERRAACASEPVGREYSAASATRARATHGERVDPDERARRDRRERREAAAASRRVAADEPAADRPSRADGPAQPQSMWRRPRRRFTPIAAA